MSQKAFINHDILQWARNRAELDPESLARGITSDYEKLIAWEDGTEHPSLAQARKLADRLRIPFGYFYLSERPDEELPIPDLRTRNDRTPNRISADLIDQIGLVQARQQWYREYRVSLGFDAVPIVGNARLREAPHSVGARIRETLNVASLQQQSSSWENFLTLLVRKVEENEILVMRSGVVGNNSRRPLNVNEFQGFAIADPLAPVVFINSKDFVAARIFTLAHELAHIWAGESGIVLFDPVSNANDAISLEIWCNAVAANMLVPSEELFNARNARESLSDQVSSLARQFRVSTTVLLRRYLELELVTRDEFFDQLAIERANQIERTQGSGGNQINNIVARSSRKFTESLVSATVEGRVDYSDASRLLGVKTNTIQTLSDQMDWR